MSKSKKLKVEKIRELKPRYSFVAPVLSASIQPKIKNAAKISAENLDLNSFLAPQPKDTYLVHVNGESMVDENIFDGDILVVDGKEKPADGKIVIASLNGEMTVKTLRIMDDTIYLVSANSNFLPIEIGPYMEFEIQGVVKHVIHPI